MACLHSHRNVYDERRIEIETENHTLCFLVVSCSTKLFLDACLASWFNKTDPVIKYLQAGGQKQRRLLVRLPMPQIQIISPLHPTASSFST